MGKERGKYLLTLSGIAILLLMISFDFFYLFCKYFIYFYFIYRNSNIQKLFILKLLFLVELLSRERYYRTEINHYRSIKYSFESSKILIGTKPINSAVYNIYQFSRNYMISINKSYSLGKKILHNFSPSSFSKWVFRIKDSN